MAQIPTSTLTVTGTAPTFQAAAAGDTAAVGDGLYLLVKNGDTVSHTVTLATPGNLVTGDAIPDKTYTVTNGGEAWIPLLIAYRDPTDGLAHITYDATTSVTVAVVKG